MGHGQRPTNTLASFGDAATGWNSEPGFDAAPEAESADGRSVSAARGYNLGTFGSQMSFSLQHNKPQRHRIKARSRILKFVPVTEAGPTLRCATAHGVKSQSTVSASSSS